MMETTPAAQDWALLEALGTLTDTAYQLREGVSHEEWCRVGPMLQKTGRGAMWWIGDWLNYGERKWGERYKEAIETTGHAYQTLRNAAWVAREFSDLSLRKDKLSWSHHLLLASVPEPRRSALMQQAEAEGWTRNRLKQEINCYGLGETPSEELTCTAADLRRLIELNRRFGTIYADPPWPYGNQGTRAATGNHYSVMSLVDLCALPVSELVEEAAHLHLWTTTSFLGEGLRLVEAWGFVYKSHLVWTKAQIGLGNYWRVSHEILLLGVRGDAPFKDKGLRSWIHAKRGKHSAKPEQVRTMIEQASPGPYLELFGRRPADNWTVWGNQIERGTLFDRDVQEVA